MKPLDELEDRAHLAVAGRSRSYVEDARDFAAAVLAFKPTHENLTTVQARCTELIHAARMAALTRDARQTRVVDWARATFGDVAMSLRERVMRFIEEAIELAQAEGLTIEEVQAVLAHVYSKPKGDPAQEIGGVSVTLLAYCEIAGLSADTSEVNEIGRIFSLGSEHFRKRQNVKADAGIAERV